MNLITSEHNPTLRHAKALLGCHRTRKKHQQTVLEGVHLLMAYLAKGTRPSRLLVGQSACLHPEVISCLAQVDSRDVLVLADNTYKKIRTLGDGVDVMAIIDTPAESFGDVVGDCVIVDGLQDAGNIGTLLRSASAVGITVVISTPASASLWSPKVLRAGMGAHFGLRIFEHMEHKAILHHVKAPLYATSSHAKDSIYHCDLSSPIAWVLGHEGRGVSDALLDRAHPIALPQPGGQESLNVAVAGSVCFYEMLRQRMFATPHVI